MRKNILYFKNGKHEYVTVTTRKANFTGIHFGKFTFWGNKEAFDKGDCHLARTFFNVHMGNDEAYLPIEANKFIEEVMNNEIKATLITK